MIKWCVYHATQACTAPPHATTLEHIAALILDTSRDILDQSRDIGGGASPDRLSPDRHHARAPKALAFLDWEPDTFAAS